MTLWDLVDIAAPNCRIRTITWDLIKTAGMQAGLDYLKQSGGNQRMLEMWEIPEDANQRTTLRRHQC